MIEFGFDNFEWACKILVSIILYVRALERRPRFALRAALSICLCLGLSFAIPYFTDPEMEGYNTLIRWGMWGGIVALSCLCFDEKVSSMLVYCLMGNTTLGIAESFAGIIMSLLGLSGRWWLLLFSVPFYALIYVFVYHYLNGARKGRHTDREQNMFLISIFVCMVAIFIAMDSIQTEDSMPLDILNAVISLLAMILLLIYWSDYRLRNEYLTVRQMLDKEKKQYETFSRYIDDINIKFHDIKHQLHSIEESAPGSSSEYLERLRKTLDLYDSRMGTDNKALDVILTEKSLQCTESNIRISFQADGSILHHMEPSDIYSLFGNLLDNAIEAVGKVEKEERRFISLTVSKEAGLAHIRVENYYEGERNQEGAGFKTTKPDSLYHGIGLKSIRFIVKKYDGTMRVTAEDGIFTANILLPLAE